MNLKLSKIIGIIIIFILCFPFHFLYKWIPNTLTSIFFPVNESIWEHMKLLFTPFIIYTLFEYFFINKNQNNLLLQLFIVPIVGIISYLIIYIPIYDLIGENMFVSISLLFIIIILQQFISYKLSIKENIKYQNVIGIIGIIITIFTFIYLTYKPININLFYDKKNHIYGIKF